jgi:hypothetical protein
MLTADERAQALAIRQALGDELARLDANEDLN